MRSRVAASELRLAIAVCCLSLGASAFKCWSRCPTEADWTTFDRDGEHRQANRNRHPGENIAEGQLLVHEFGWRCAFGKRAKLHRAAPGEARRRRGGRHPAESGRSSRPLLTRRLATAAGERIDREATPRTGRIRGPRSLNSSEGGAIGASRRPGCYLPGNVPSDAESASSALGASPVRTIR